MVEKVMLFYQNHQSDHTKHQDHCRRCADENNCSGTSVAFMVFCVRGNCGRVGISMVWKYSVATLIFCHVHCGMFFYTEQCNVTVLQLNWYDVIPVNTQPWLVGI